MYNTMLKRFNTKLYVQSFNYRAILTATSIRKIYINFCTHFSLIVLI